MRRYHSSHAFEKYRPYQSPWQRFLNYRKQKKQQKIMKSIVVKNSETDGWRIGLRSKKHRDNQNIGFFSLKVKIILFFSFLIAWITLLLYLPYFRISNITYWGLENTDQSEIASYLKQNYVKENFYLPLNSYFFVNTDKISKALQKKFSFDTVEARKIFPNELRIIVQEKKAAIFYDNTKNYYLMDGEGKILKLLTAVGDDEYIFYVSTTTISTTSASGIESKIDVATTTKKHFPNYQKIATKYGQRPILVDRRAISVDIGQENILPKNFAPSILASYEQLTQKKIATPHYFLLENIGAGLEIFTSKQWNILFQPNNDLDNQISNLTTILKTNKPTSYIDIRFGGRVYWK
jgi:hypothetical protein